MNFDITLYTQLKEISSELCDLFDVKIIDERIILSRYYENIDASLEDVLISFIDEFDSCKDAFELDSILQVAVYYEVEKNITYTIRLNKTILNNLSDKGISIEITAYPCSD